MATMLQSLKIQQRVLYALLMREIITRFGRKNLGVLWLVGEPMQLFQTQAAIRQLAIHHAPALGADIHRQIVHRSAGSRSVTLIFDHTYPIHMRQESVNGPAALNRLTHVAEPFAGGQAHVIRRNHRIVREETREVTMAKSAARDSHNQASRFRDQKIVEVPICRTIPRPAFDAPRLASA